MQLVVVEMTNLIFMRKRRRQEGKSNKTMSANVDMATVHTHQAIGRIPTLIEAAAN